MKNKTIKLIGRMAILGFMTAIVLLPTNTKASCGVLMTDGHASPNAALTDVTEFIDYWLNFNNTEQTASGVLMGD